MPDDTRRVESKWDAGKVAQDLRAAFKEHGIQATITPRTTDVRV